MFISPHDNAIYSKWVSKNIRLRYLGLLLSGKGLNGMAGGTGQPYISQSTLNELIIDLPPITEQNEIIRLFDCSMIELRRLMGTIEKCEKLNTKLESALLKDAFEGKLVPQDPNDEPASVLLERLKSGKIDKKRAQTKLL
jgi:restriction endonuclease S subunit